MAIQNTHDFSGIPNRHSHQSAIGIWRSTRRRSGVTEELSEYAGSFRIWNFPGIIPSLATISGWPSIGE